MINIFRLNFIKSMLSILPICFMSIFESDVGDEEVREEWKGLLVGCKVCQD